MSPLSVPRKWQLLLTGETGKEEGKKRGGEKGRVCVCVPMTVCVQLSVWKVTSHLFCSLTINSLEAGEHEEHASQATVLT